MKRFHATEHYIQHQLKLRDLTYQSILALHEPTQDKKESTWYCQECMQNSPCRTVQIIEGQTFMDWKRMYGLSQQQVVRVLNLLTSWRNKNLHLQQAEEIENAIYDK